MHQDEAEALAGRFFEAAAAGDLDTVADLYTPDATVWVNLFPQFTMDVGQNLKLLTSLQERIVDMAYTDRTVRATSDGFVEEHRLTGRVGDIEISAWACLVCTVDADGRVTSLREYIDSGATAALAAGS